MALVLVLSVTACSNSTEKKDGNKQTEAKSTKQIDKKALGGELSTFAYEVQVAISSAYAPYGTLESYAGVEGAAYVDADVADAAAKTQNSASSLDSIKIPNSLSAYKDQLNGALQDLKDSFTKRAEAAKAATNVKDGKALSTVVDNINNSSKASFDSFQKEFNKVAKDLGLGDMNFAKALN